MSSDQVLENLLDWCIKHTNILTAEDESSNFIQYVKGKVFIKVLKMLIKTGKKADMDFKKSMNSCFSKEAIIQFIFGWYCRNTNLLSAKDPISGRGIVHYATENGCIPVVDCLLKVTSINPVEGLVNSCDHSSSTPLLIASDKGHYGLAKMDTPSPGSHATLKGVKEKCLLLRTYLVKMNILGIFGQRNIILPAI